MILSDISVKRPVFAGVLSLLIILFGILSFTRLPLREYPDIDPPVVSVDTTYVGASAAIVESRVTQVIENIVSGIEGIEAIESISEDGRSTITIEFNINRDVDAAANDVRDRVSRVLDNLPDEVDPPEISKLDANTSEIMWLALQSDSRSGLELTDYADRNLVDRLSVVPGVARVRIGGERRYAMRIWLDRKALAARELTVSDIESALLQENVELPAGRVESLNREFTVRVERAYQTAEDFKNLVIRRGEDGYLIRLGDVAKVEIGPENERSELRANGRSNIGLGISKQSKANTLEVAQGVKQEMAEIAAILPQDIDISVAYDSSLFIEEAINEVYVTLGITILLVGVVIWAFLGDWRATIIPMVAIPVSLIGSFIILYFLGFSINLLTLLALVLAIGLVVDDAIVVLENIYKRVEEGKPRLISAYLGTRQVAFAVIATTMVLVAVFLPITFMQGDAGRLFTEFAWAISGAVIVSSFVALTLSPVLCSKILSTEKCRKGKNPITNFINNFLMRVQGGYRKGLDVVLSTKGAMITVGLTLLLIGFGGWIMRGIPSEYAPTEDRGYFFNIMIAPEGSSLEYSKRHMRLLEEQMLTLLSAEQNPNGDQGTGEARRVVTIVPGGFSATGAVNGGFAIVLLVPWDQRERGTQEIVGEMFGRYSQIPGVLAFPIMPPSLGQNPRETPVQFVIGGSEYEQLAEWRDQMLEQIQTNPNLVNVDHDYKETRPQLRIDVDLNRAADLGISSRQIGQTLETMFGSRDVTTFLDRGEEYQVVVQNQPQDRLTPRDLRNVYVRSERTGELIPLSNLISIREIAEAGELNRFNRLRAITISANLAPGYTLGEALTYLEETARATLPEEAVLDYKGLSREYKQTGGEIYFIFVLALLAVYLILAAQFESFVHPFVVMTAVPFAIVGALWGLYLTGETLNIYTQVALIMLVGLSAKNGILIVEFANQLRDQGLAFTEAVIQAAQQRLRPILMTSLSTAAGAIPLILAEGAGAESRFPIGVVIFAGVVFSTFLTLFVIPAFYGLIARKTGSPLATTHKLHAQLREHDHSDAR